MLSVYRTTLFWFPAVLLATLALSGCQTTNSPLLTPVIVSPYSSAEAEAGSNDVGALAISIGGHNANPMTFTLNGSPLTTNFWSYLWLPIKPGTHQLRYFWSGAGSKNHLTTFSVKPGETIYLVEGEWPFDEYRQVSKATFIADLKDRGARFEPDRRATLKAPRHTFLPASDLSLLNSCLEKKIKRDCDKAVATIPKILIDKDAHSKMVAMANRTEPAKQVQQPASAPAPSVAVSKAPAPAPQPKIANLPPEIERDRLMVQIADLFKANNAVDALPLFKRLNDLPVPIDPVSDFYWAQSLLANGDRAGASVKLSRFLGTIDSSSPYYAPALRLMTKMED